MIPSNDDASTDLYLVRVWKQKPGDSRPELHGKLQHVVSGASCYFDELSSLPQALREMMRQLASPSGSAAESSTLDVPDEQPRGDERQN